MFKNLGNTLKFLLAMLIIVSLTYAGMAVGKQVVALDIVTTENKQESERLKALEANQQKLEESLKLANFKTKDVENALPSNLMKERILSDVYRAKYSVSDFERSSVQVAFSGDMSTQTVAGETEEDTVTVKKQRFTVKFNSTTEKASYERIKAFMLEMEKTPRTYKIIDMKCAKNDNQAVETVLTMDAYGMSANKDEKSIVQDYGFNWFSPTIKGKTTIFTLQPVLNDWDLNYRIFDSTYPTSFVKDFVLNINSKDQTLPTVSFQRYKGYNSSLGGEHYNITLNIVQGGDKYFYSFEVGDEKYPPTEESELHVYNGRDIIISVADDSDIASVPLLKQVTLTVKNQTDKTVRVVGDTEKRLRLIGEGNVVK